MDPQTISFGGNAAAGEAPTSYSVSSTGAPTQVPTAPGVIQSPTSTPAAPSTPSTPSTPAAPGLQMPSTSTGSTPTGLSSLPSGFNLPSTAANYNGDSVVDFLSSAGLPADINSRTTLAGQLGISNYTGTAAQNTQLLGILQAHAKGNLTSTGLPSNIGSILGVTGNISPTTPIPASSLGNTNDGSINSILSAGVANGTVDSTTAGILAAYGQPTPQDTAYNALNDQLTTLTGQLGNEGTDQTAALNAAGIPSMTNQVQDLNVQASQLTGQIAAFDAETQQGLSNLGNQQVTQGFINSDQANYQKQRDLTKAGLTAQLTATTALMNAYNGNIDTATKQVQTAIDLKYQPIQNEITTLQQQISAAKDTMTQADTAKANVITALLKNAADNLATQKTNQTSIQTLAVQAASNGAPLSVVNQMKAATDPATAASIGSQYVGTKSNQVGPGGPASNTFTKTQINNGAQNSGLDINSFAQLPADVQNYFINADQSSINSFNQALSDIATGKEQASDVAGEISSSNLPQDVKDYLTQQINNTKQGSTGSGSGVLSKVGGFFGSIWNGIKSVF